MAGSLERRAGAEDLEELHEINVTPFIDVMLVLLIIFMIAAPLATVDVVDLPGSTAEPAPRPAEPVYLTVRDDLTLTLGDAAVARPVLGPQLDALAGGDKDTRIFLRADRAVAYGDLMEVMDLLRAAGYLKMALVGLEVPPDVAGAP